MNSITMRVVNCIVYMKVLCFLQFCVLTNATMFRASQLVQTQFGRINGSLNTASDTVSWLGVRFGAPPIDNLRWKAPQSPSNWTGVKFCPILLHRRKYNVVHTKMKSTKKATKKNTELFWSRCATFWQHAPFLNFTVDQDRFVLNFFELIHK